MLLVTEGGGLAGGADGDEAMDAARDLAFDQGHESVLIECAIAEGRHERRENAAEKGFGHVSYMGVSKRP